MRDPTPVQLTPETGGEQDCGRGLGAGSHFNCVRVAAAGPQRVNAEAVRRDFIGELPTMQRAGRTDVSDLRVTVNELTPVSAPLYAVA